jgi:hypothetical protein
MVSFYFDRPSVSVCQALAALPGSTVHDSSRAQQAGRGAHTGCVATSGARAAAAGAKVFSKDGTHSKKTKTNQLELGLTTGKSRILV